MSQVMVAETAVDLFDRFVSQNNVRVSRQLELLSRYLDLHRLFPQITFAAYLERLTATRDVPDALEVLDVACPPKKGGAWTPSRRTSVLLTYVTYIGLDPSPIPFEAFAQDEASQVLAAIAKETPAASPVPERPQVPPTETAATPAAATPAVTPPVETPAPVAETPAAAHVIIAVSVPQADAAVAAGLLALDAPHGSPMNAVLWEQTHAIPEVGKLYLVVANATPQPYLDVYVTDGDGKLLADVPPIDKHTMSKSGGALPPELSVTLPDQRVVLLNINWGQHV